MKIKDLGLIDFDEALRIQEEEVRSLRQGGAETLLLLEHLPVYTIGAGGSLANVLDPQVRALRINRGGDVTYHGPGQLVGYPIIDLSGRGRDLHRYLRFLEQFLVRIAGELGVHGFTVAGKTGVWTERGKLASIGVGVRQWVTMHGFCLNVAAELSPFERINPCGMARCPITSLALERGAPLPLDPVKTLIGSRFDESLNHAIPRQFA